MLIIGFEPIPLKGMDFKSIASTNSAKCFSCSASMPIVQMVDRLFAEQEMKVRVFLGSFFSYFFKYAAKSYFFF